MTLLDILPSLRGTTTPRLDPLVWPVTTHCHHGRITVGGVGLDEIADRFGVPTYVLDEESVGGGGKTFVHGLRDAEMLYRTAPLLPCGVARSVAERRLTVVVHSRRDVALARQGGLDPDSIVLVVDAADSRSHSEVPPWPGGVGRIVVGAGVRIDTVAAPGPESGRQKTIVGVRDTCCAGATIRRVVAAPGLDLVGIRCDCVPTVGDIREQVLTAVAVMCDGIESTAFCVPNCTSVSRAAPPTSSAHPISPMPSPMPSRTRVSGTAFRGHVFRWMPDDRSLRELR
ncbi:hypothetical protein [Rhodococcus koreensis]|uniref:hypothetical protein n=1 Tax=Rhodococcus koreensis TaxID=99653 RepID=UPI00366D9FA1